MPEVQEPVLGSPKIQIGFCQCGCGEKTALWPDTNKNRGRIKGQPKFFINGHNQRGKTFSDEHRSKISHSRKGWNPSKATRVIWSNQRTGKRIGPANHAYVGGLYPVKMRDKMRWMVRCRDGREVYFSHVVMEGIVGREIRTGYLPESEIVHHVNEDTTDDRPENLKLMTQHEHSSFHATKHWESIRKVLP